MYPENTIPVAEANYTWTDSLTGLTWRGECNSASTVAWGALALATTLFVATQ